jgi:hypothetical protein
VGCLNKGWATGVNAQEFGISPDAPETRAAVGTNLEAPHDFPRRATGSSDGYKDRITGYCFGFRRLRGQWL